MSVIKERIAEEVVDEKLRLAEPLPIPVVGIAAIVVSSRLAALTDEDIHILTVTENTAKPETGKQKGQRAVVQETVRLDALGIPESNQATLRGALLEEIIDPEMLPDVGRHFHRSKSNGQRIEILLDSLPGTKGGVEVVIFSGEPGDLLIKGGDEVINKRWEPVSSFLDSSHVRPTSKELVGFAKRHGLIRLGLHQYQSGQAEPLFPEGFDHRTFLQRRSNMQDITHVDRKN